MRQRGALDREVLGHGQVAAREPEQEKRKVGQQRAHEVWYRGTSGRTEQQEPGGTRTAQQAVELRKEAQQQIVATFSPNVLDDNVGRRRQHVQRAGRLCG